MLIPQFPLRRLFICLVMGFTASTLTGCRSRPVAVSGESGSSKNVTPVTGSGSTWATGTLPQYATGVPSSFIDRVNSYRAANGLSALIYHDGVSLAAKRHTEDMSSSNYFGLYNPVTGVDIPTRLVSSSPRIDFDNLKTFILHQDVAPTQDAAWDLLIADEPFRKTILDPNATHLGGYWSGHFTFVVGYNVVPTNFVVATPPAVTAPAPVIPSAPTTTTTPSSGGGGGGGGYYVIRYIRI